MKLSCHQLCLRDCLPGDMLIGYEPCAPKWHALSHDVNNAKNAINEITKGKSYREELATELVSEDRGNLSIKVAAEWMIAARSNEFESRTTEINQLQFDLNYFLNEVLNEQRERDDTNNKRESMRWHARSNDEQS